MKILALLGCLAASGLWACTGPRAPLDGIWALPHPVPGSSLVLRLTQSGGALTGNGTYSIEGSNLGSTLTISGTFVPPAVNLQIEYDYGLKATFEGTLVDDTTMSGMETFPAGPFPPDSLTLTRQ